MTDTPQFAGVITGLTASSTNGVLSVGIIFWTFATVAVILRFWTRTMIVRVLGKDDWFMLVALVRFQFNVLKQKLILN
jgi:hypothetical protein